MGDPEANIAATLDQFERDLDSVRDHLSVLLEPPSLDVLSAQQAAPQQAAPYAMGAYALSSLLFAYLRSEGQDTAIVMPELARVRDRMEKLSKPAKPAKSAPTEKPRKKRRSGDQPKHTRFDEPKKPKKSRKQDA